MLRGKKIHNKSTVFHSPQGLRPDGRKTLFGLRPVSLSVGTISRADGSSIVKQGNTIVTCGVTLELAKPKGEEPDKGMDGATSKCEFARGKLLLSSGFIVPNLDLPPLCHPRFKPGPPSEQAQTVTQFILETIENSKLLDKRSLCIRPGKLAWVVCIDLVCLNYDGNVVDAAIKAMVCKKLKII